MEFEPMCVPSPEEKSWENVGVATDTQLTQAANRYCRDTVGAAKWDQMTDGQRRVHLLDTMYPEGWNMVEVPQQYPEYPQSVGMYEVTPPTTWQIQRARVL